MLRGRGGDAMAGEGGNFPKDTGEGWALDTIGPLFPGLPTCPRLAHLGISSQQPTCQPATAPTEGLGVFCVVLALS